MQQKPRPISGVPSNIITGFLGVGKTTTILQLLKNKPEGERWAVLVNEFGEIGIDGALFEGQHSEQSGVFIREVPGGCMCCTAGLPMRVALTQLLRRAKPDRLLIEPTGLGHPKEVLQTLHEPDFQGVLAIQNIITLVDAKHLSNKQYVEHETFQQQIAIADVIVANKQDQYTDDDKAKLKTYLSKSKATLVFADHGTIDSSILNGATTATTTTSDHTHHEHSHHTKSETGESTDTTQPFEEPLPECGYIKAVNNGGGFTSIGWRFASHFEFDQGKLFNFLSGVNAERLKATFITNHGCFAYNVAQGTLTENSFEQLSQSRIEIITNQLNDEWEQALFDCLTTKTAVPQ